MKMTLAPELEELIRQKVDAGLYRDAEDVVRQALELLDQLDRDPVARKAALRAAIKRGLDAYDAGQCTIINNEQELAAFFDDL